MSNTLYLDETLTDFEREFAIESAKIDISIDKLNVLYEAVDSTLKANYMEAELKVYAENGTYDDLAMLYTEAENEASQKKSGIISSIFNAIKDLCNKTKEFITGLFKKKVEESPTEELEVNEESYNTLKSSKSFGAIVKSGLSNLKTVSKASLEKFKENIEKHKILTAAISAGTVAVAAGAGAGIHHAIKVKKSEAMQLSAENEATMKEISDAADTAEAVINAVNLGASAVSAATDNSTSDKGQTANKFANGILEKIPVLKDICSSIRNAVANISDAVKNLFVDKNKKKEKLDRHSRWNNPEFFFGDHVGDLPKQISDSKITQRLMVALAKKKNMDMKNAEDREKLKAEVAPQVEEFKEIFKKHKDDVVPYYIRNDLISFKKKYGVSVESANDLLEDDLLYEAFVDYYIESCMEDDTPITNNVSLNSLLNSI